MIQVGRTNQLASDKRIKKKYDETTDKKIENNQEVSSQEEIIFGKHAVMETLKKK